MTQNHKLYWPCDRDTAETGLFSTDDLEHCINQKFTEAHYISLLHLPPARSIDSENSKAKIHQERLIGGWIYISEWLRQQH